MTEDPHAHETRERWGNTDAYRESQRRVAGYTSDQWEQQQADAKTAVKQVLAAMEAGLLANSPEAKEGAEAHRLHIDKWFYPVSYDMHVGLAEMYLADSRFTQFYEQIAPGLAKYLHDAILANAIDQVG